MERSFWATWHLSWAFELGVLTLEFAVLSQHLIQPRRQCADLSGELPHQDQQLPPESVSSAVIMQESSMTPQP